MGPRHLEQLAIKEMTPKHIRFLFVPVNEVVIAICLRCIDNAFAFLLFLALPL
jgi:hypothetical protein